MSILKIFYLFYIKNCYFIYKELKKLKMNTLKFKKFNIETYKPGKSSVKRLKKIIKLSANESALGVSAKVKKLISNKKISFFRYPDGKSKELRNQISKKFR